MALNEMKFLGNDLFFKYRYAQETSVNVTTVEESWNIESGASWYKIMADYFKRSFNMKLIYEGYKVKQFDVSQLITAPDFLNNANVIMIPRKRSLFDGRLENFCPAPIFLTAKTIIVSAAPKKVTSTSLSFLNVDTPVLILTVSALLFLSLLLVTHSIVTNKYKSLSNKKVVKIMAKETLENFWEYASLLCAEPIPTVLPHITCRLLASSWLIGVTFILFFLGCFLRTEFTTESYKYIDTLSDLIKSGISPIMFKESGNFDYLKYLATLDPVVKKWLDALDQENIFASVLDMYTLEGYLPILLGEKSLIAADIFLIWFLGGSLKSDSGSKMIMAENGGLYFSHQDISFDYQHFFFNTSWLRSSPQVQENLQLSLEQIFETQVFNYMYIEKEYLIEQVKWKRPLKSTTDLDLSSVSVPFYFLFTFLSGTVAAAITEVLFNRFV